MTAATYLGCGPRRGSGRLRPANSVPLSAQLLQNGTLKTYEGFPHGMPTTEADTINADLLAFLSPDRPAGSASAVALHVEFALPRSTQWVEGAQSELP